MLSVMDDVSGRSVRPPVERLAMRRAIGEATRHELVGRVVWTLAARDDGVADLTVSLARIAPGRMNAHRHGPGGEAMYVPSGRGILWVEGLPVALAAGTAAVAPEGLLHNAENIGPRALVVIGCFCPGVVPGSYAEEAPRFSSTGVLRSTAALRPRPPDRSTAGGRGPSRADLRVDVLVDDPVLSPNIAMRRLRIPAGMPAIRSATGRARAWVVLAGGGRVVAPRRIAGRLALSDAVVVAPDQEARFAAAARPLTLLEFEVDPAGMRPASFATVTSSPSRH